MKELLPTLTKILKTASGIYVNPIEIFIIRKNQFRVLRSLKLGKKWLVLVILQGQQGSVWVFILVHCMLSFFSLEHQIKVVFKLPCLTAHDSGTSQITGISFLAFGMK